ncbi:50S ribosomal protein L3 [Anaerolineales bacterium HSG6]|nr:50S ribosomal protein L3 [Anaerolineales bacterium HSG6]MDM8530088.1 50S ribosomal protein L3 [Anaerolineales bacterium HSG25]
MKGILGRKLGMTQVFGDDGVVTPVTIVEAGPCYITQKKTMELDGYHAIQLGFFEVNDKALGQPKRKHLAKSGSPMLRYLRELSVGNSDDYELGQKIEASVFENGDLVDVTATSKGKGFAGGVKRHNFKGGPKTHGQSDRHRAPGSVGAGSTPGRIFKGTRMAGRMGGERVTVQNLRITLVDAKKNLIAIKGAVPGAKNGLLMIREAVKTKRPSGDK